MAESAIIDDILTVLRDHGGDRYGGEVVTQLQHALQAATLAEVDGADDRLIAAALLHDLGHLIHHLGERAAQDGVDDAHEHRAQAYLERHFPESVCAPVRMHVEAKRYLCRTEPGYWDGLSPQSKLTLELQGGMFDPDEAAVFIARPHAPAAVRLRRWDDAAKDPDVETPGLDHFRPVLERSLRET